jgi:hypothetical protein
MLVIDASTAIDLCLAPDGFAALSEKDLIAPPLILRRGAARLGFIVTPAEL